MTTQPPIQDSELYTIIRQGLMWAKGYVDSQRRALEVERTPTPIDKAIAAMNMGAATPYGVLSREEDTQKTCPAPANLPGVCLGCGTQTTNLRTHQCHAFNYMGASGADCARAEASIAGDVHQNQAEPSPATSCGIPVVGECECLEYGPLCKYCEALPPLVDNKFVKEGCEQFDMIDEKQLRSKMIDAYRSFSEDTEYVASKRIDLMMEEMRPYLRQPEPVSGAVIGENSPTGTYFYDAKAKTIVFVSQYTDTEQPVSVEVCELAAQKELERQFDRDDFLTTMDIKSIAKAVLDAAGVKYVD